MTKRELIGAAVALVLLLAAGAMWLREHDLATKADAVKVAQDQVIAGAQKEITAAQADRAKAQETLTQQLAAIAAQRQAPAPTPQQVVVDVSKLIPTLPTPLKVQDVAATPTAPATQNVVIPKEDIPALQNYKLDCDEKGARLDACTLTTASLQTELTATNTKLTATAKERDADAQALKGGTFWKRLGHTAKCLAFSAGGSAAGAWADKQQPARGAVIGAVAGGVGCQLF